MGGGPDAPRAREGAANDGRTPTMPERTHAPALLVPLVPLVLLGSCASMAGRGPDMAQLRAEAASRDLLPRAAALAPTATPARDGPLRVGIAPPWLSSAPGLEIFGSRYARGRMDGPGYDVWTDDERAVIDSWCAAAREAGLLADFEYLPGLMAATEGVPPAEAFTSAARSRGLDAVLVSRVGTTYWADPTALSILDLALVTTLFVPTADFTATALVEAALVDVDSGHVYAAGAAESTYGRMAPPFGADVIAYQRRARLAGVEAVARRLGASASGWGGPP